MTASQQTTALLVEVIPARPEQEPVLANLLELYAHDFSEIIELELDADGRFGYKHLSLYWTEATRHPFLITVNGKLAGFALVRKGSHVSGAHDVWDVAEFFIARGYRRHRLGMRAAHDVWRKFPGRWEVRVMERNRRAREFWRRAVAEFTGETPEPIAFEKDGELWHVFSFASTEAA